MLADVAVSISELFEGLPEEADAGAAAQRLFRRSVKRGEEGEAVAETSAPEGEAKQAPPAALAGLEGDAAAEVAATHAVVGKAVAPPDEGGGPRAQS